MILGFVYPKCIRPLVIGSFAIRSFDD